MAEALIFHYLPGKTCLYQVDVRVKMGGMICLSFLLISVNAFKLITIFPLLMILQSTLGMGKERPSPFFLVMPLIIFSGNFFSLTLSGGESLTAGLLTALMLTLRFIFILWIANMFIRTTDPLTITPSVHFYLKRIPFIPAGRISTQMGLTLTLIPLILDEMAEIRDAMKSRCGWKAHRPVRNLIHMGLPLLEGVLKKAERLSDAMESRLYTEDATEPEIMNGSSWKIPLLILSGLTLFIISVEKWTGRNSFFDILLQTY